MTANLFGKLFRKTTMSMQHNAVRSQTRKSLETLDQTLNQSDESTNQSEIAISPKLSLASLHLDDSVSSTIIPPIKQPINTSSATSAARSPGHAFRSLKSSARNSLPLLHNRRSLLDHKYKQLQDVMSMPDQSSNHSTNHSANALHAEVLQHAIDEIVKLRQENSQLSTTVAHMSQLMCLSMKELGEAHAKNKLLKTPPMKPAISRAVSTSNDQTSQPIKRETHPSQSLPPRHAPPRRLMYNDNFTYSSTPMNDDDNNVSTTVKIEPIDSLSRTSAESSESSLLALSQAASLASQKPKISSRQLSQLMTLMRLQEQLRLNMPVAISGSNSISPVARREQGYGKISPVPSKGAARHNPY